MANLYNKKNLLASEKFKKSVNMLYHKDPSEVIDRFDNLITTHTELYGDNFKLFSSPGRIEVCGNHTDHNNGKVVCASVTIDTLAVVSKLNSKEIIINSVGYPLVKIDIGDLNVYEGEFGTSEALARGVVKGFVDRGYNVGGFVATTTSNVFKGAGVSSSAAFEVLAAEILNILYNDGKISKIDKAIISQYAENVYFGKPSGLMDQSAIALGGVSFIDFKDPKVPVVKSMKWNFDDVSVVIVNCGGDHCNLTPQYSSIRLEMESVAAEFGQKQLRFVDEKEFYDRIAELSKKLSGRALLRAQHYFDENRRVDNLVNAIINGDEDIALSTITASGKSSYTKLQNCYAEGDHSETIPLALSLCEKFDGVKAYRVHGGGFAGTILTFVKNESRDAFGKYMGNIFGKENVFVLGIRAEGATEIEVF